MSIGGSFQHLTAGLVLNTGGTTTWTGSGLVRVGTGALITNHGTWECQSDATMENYGGPTAAFNNGGTGTFKTAAGVGTTTVGIPFTNAGSVQALSGTLLFTNGYPQTAGVTTQNGGDVLAWRYRLRGIRKYEGVLGDFTSHVPALCSTGGATTATFAPAAGDRYYPASTPGLRKLYATPWNPWKPWKPWTKKRAPFRKVLETAP